MAGYSRENKRQNEALQNIMAGGVPESRIFVSGVDKEFKKELEEKYGQVNIDLKDGAYEEIVEEAATEEVK